MGHVRSGVYSCMRNASELWCGRSLAICGGFSRKKSDWQGAHSNQTVYHPTAQYQGIQRCHERIYISRLEDSLDRHCLIERLGQLHTTHKSKQAFCKGLNKLDKQSKDIMLNAEKKCRRIKSGQILFSPEAVLWIRCTQVYRSLLRYHGGFI